MKRKPGAKPRNSAKERQLFESRQKYQDLVETISDFIWEMDRSGKYTYCSPQMRTLWGYDPAEMIGKTPFDVMPQEMRATAIEQFQAYVKDPRPFSGLQIPSHDSQGRLILVEVSGTPFTDLEGKLLGYRGISRDITERSATEMALRKNEALLRALIENSPDPIYVKDKDSRWLLANPAVLRVVNRNLDDAMGKTDLELFADSQTGRAILENDRRLLESGKPQSFEEVVDTPEGRRVFLSTKAPWRDGQGDIIGLIGISRDITAEKELKERLEQRVERRTKQLDESNLSLRQEKEEKANLVDQLEQTQKLEAVGLLAGGIAHDFNNLIAAIVGNNYFLLEGLPVDSPLRTYCEDIVRSTDMAASLTRQLLAISRKQVVQPRILDINSVLISLSKMLERVLGRHIQIKMNTQSALWPVKMDTGQLEQIIMNLALNARDAMPKGGTMRLGTANKIVTASDQDPSSDGLRPGRYVCLEVSDTGIGMGAAIQARVFEPFFTTKEAGRGKGLGMAVVQRIVKQYKGNVSVESQPGRGTLFRILIPCVKGGAEAMLPGEAPKNGYRGHESLLLVEDNDAFGAILKLALEKQGYAVTCVNNAEEALAYGGNGKTRIDLLLTDIVLPGMDGRDLAVQLRKSHPGLKVVYISGYTGGANAAECISDGVLLEKPFSPEKLLITLRHMLEEQRPRGK
jgi:PAS domain S-box-containing protein